jgi:hypothetical protein
MASLKELSKGRKDLFMMDPRILTIEPGWNKRKDTPELTAYIEWLKDSIKATPGVIEPLTIYRRGEDLVITNGHCRHRACLELIAEGTDIEAVPVRVEDEKKEGTNEIDRALSQITRNSGKPFTPLERAEVFKQCLGYGSDIPKIARKTGFSETYIQNLMALLASPQPILAAVERGEVSASLAVQVQKDSPADAPQILKEAGKIAKAQGKAKTTPKHVKEAQEARQEARENPSAAPAKKVRVDWLKVGPKLKRLVEDAITATDPTKSLKKLSEFYEANFGETE